MIYPHIILDLNKHPIFKILLYGTVYYGSETRVFVIYNGNLIYKDEMIQSLKESCSTVKLLISELNWTYRTSGNDGYGRRSDRHTEYYNLGLEYEIEVVGTFDKKSMQIIFDKPEINNLQIITYPIPSYNHQFNIHNLIFDICLALSRYFPPYILLELINLLNYNTRFNWSELRKIHLIEKIRNSIKNIFDRRIITRSKKPIKVWQYLN